MAFSQRRNKDRLSRLLVMLPWLMEQESVPVREVAERFDLSEAEVTADLQLAAMCGLPPYSDELVDLYIDDDTIYPGVPRLFTKPLRLTAAEGFALLAAGRAALAMPGGDPAGPLARGLNKIAQVLGGDAVVVDLDTPAAAITIVEAVRRLERLDIRYWSAARNEMTERQITPRRVFHDRGEWYVVASDHRSGEQRTFRIDRIESISPTGVFDDPVDELDDGPPRWFDDPSIPRVRLRLAPAAQWVAERYPVDSAERLSDGTMEVVMPVASERFLARLLVRLGPDATTDDPDVSERAAAAAAAVLDRYR